MLEKAWLAAFTPYSIKIACTLKTSAIAILFE
jgi:hypothetical protein